jgi:hypothetical protein
MLLDMKGLKKLKNVLLRYISSQDYNGYIDPKEDDEYFKFKLDLEDS